MNLARGPRDAHSQPRIRPSLLPEHASDGDSPEEPLPPGIEALKSIAQQFAVDSKGPGQMPGIERLAGAAWASRCGTPLAELLDRASRVPGTPPELTFLTHRWQNDDLADLTYVYETEHFLIMYWRFGKEAADLADQGGVIKDPDTGDILGLISPGSGVPDYVERAAFWLERSYEAFSTYPMSMQPANGTPPIIVKIDSRWPPAWGGEINLTIGMVDDQLAGVCIHETFHVFQSRYSTYGGQFPDEDLYLAIKEGGADLAIDLVADSYDYYIKTEAALREPRWSAFSSINPHAGMGKNGWPYPYSLFLKYFSEQQSYLVGPYNEPRIGVDAIRKLYEACYASGYGRAGMEAACRGTSVKHRTFCDFTRIGTDVACSETLLGNFWLALYLKDLPAGAADRRFSLLENANMPKLALQGDRPVTQGTPGFVADSTLKYAALPCTFRIGADVDSFEVKVDRPGATSPVLIQAALVDEFGSLVDIIRTDDPVLLHVFPAHRYGRRIDHVYVVCCSTGSIVGYNLHVTAVPPAPDVTVTSWNCAEGMHYEVDPFDWGWAWLSPDIWVDNSGQGYSSGGLHAGKNNMLVVRVRNQGAADAGNVAIAVEYQSAASLPLDPAGWQPIADAGGAPVAIPPQFLAADAIVPVTIAWTPPASLQFKPVALRVRVSCPADPNSLNKVAFTILSPEPVEEIDFERRFPRPADPLWDPIKERPRAVPRTGSRRQFAPGSLVPIEASEGKQEIREQYRLRLRDGPGSAHRTFAPGTRESLARRLDGEPRAFEHRRVNPATVPPGADAQDYVTVNVSSPQGHGAGFSWLPGARSPAGAER